METDCQSWLRFGAAAQTVIDIVSAFLPVGEKKIGRHRRCLLMLRRLYTSDAPWISMSFPFVIVVTIRFSQSNWQPADFGNLVIHLGDS